MKNTFAIIFAVLMLLSIAVFIVGLLTEAVVPWFGGLRAETIGEIGCTASGLGECCTYLFAWLYDLSSNRKNPVLGFPGQKKYVHKKPDA